MSVAGEVVVATWNVNGFSSSDRVKAVEQWLKTRGKGVQILALQELKTGEQTAEFNLRRLMLGATCVIDYAGNEQGGAALIINQAIQVLESGVKGTGNFAWAKIKLQGKVFSVASVYGPHGNGAKIEFFSWLKDRADGEHWIMLGDWNMVLLREDTSGPSPLLKGEPLQTWNDLDLSWNLDDAWLKALQRKGPRFTRQAVRGQKLDQARLDRAYISCNSSWIKVVNCTTHDSSSAISDHYPVSIGMDITTRTPKKKKRVETYIKMDVETYIKMDVETLKNPWRQAQIKAAWEEGWSLSPDPILAWELAWGRARELFKSYKRLETEVREAELLEASILRRRSRIRWIKEGETNSKYFFNCLKAKHERERLTALVNAAGD
ncbi:hypothetical protein R1sor_001728 [Riccia sorocarpa]|uniref:Endonuclease/exonuclease/phosphatase domain-containing protein n=1 Tax=Riccia sorocarpa TaxID=122646 RepID=A0ABD3GYE3_9MARC